MTISNPRPTDLLPPLAPLKCSKPKSKDEQIARLLRLCRLLDVNMNWDQKPETAQEWTDAELLAISELTD